MVVQHILAFPVTQCFERQTFPFVPRQGPTLLGVSELDQSQAGVWQVRLQSRCLGVDRDGVIGVDGSEPALELQRLIQGPHENQAYVF